VLPSNTRLPDRSEHWNYLTSVTASPDGKLLLVGSEAGSSDSHFEDYWLFDRASRTWRYAGGGNEAKWSEVVAGQFHNPVVHFERVGANRKDSRLGGASNVARCSNAGTAATHIRGFLRVRLLLVYVGIDAGSQTAQLPVRLQGAVGDKTRSCRRT
jgi:hypothetical protein